ncbi:MAG: DUF3396 domain-containing protein [Sandaracinaceae bacterium]|nr:DUF3396 domain-containing protein [Sandaracinaceae bacterium]
MNPVELPELWLARYERDPGRTLARAALGFTAYLADPGFWAREGAHRFFDFFRARIPPHLLKNLATSTSPYWRTVAAQDFDGIAETMRQAALIGRPRHLFRMRLQNEPGAESVGFQYNEVDPQRANRSAVLQVSFPEMASPGDLIAYVNELLSIGPVHSLIGGIAFRWDEADEGWAFNRIYRLASRYLAIDIQKYTEMAWKTPSALPGSSWLTYVGPELAKRAEIDLEALAHRPWQHGVMSGFVHGGVMVQAGPEPVQGDLNRLKLPAAYIEAAHALSPWFADEPPKFWGPFHTLEQSGLWFRRLVDPTPWIERKIPLD